MGRTSTLFECRNSTCANRYFANLYAVKYGTSSIESISLNYEKHADSTTFGNK